MQALLASLLNFYQFSTGRRLFAMQELHKMATAESLGTLANCCAIAIDHDRTTRVLEARWAARKPGAQYSRVAKQLDILVDTALSALSEGLENEAKHSPPEDALAARADTLHKSLFPKGVGAVVTLNYVDELAEVERILAMVKSPEWANVIVDLGLSRRVQRLSDLESQYRAAIADTGDQLAFDEVRAARQRGQNLMLQAVALVIGLYPTDDAGDVERRTKLLAPIFRQNEAIREALRGRQNLADVNPDTGEPEESAPIPEPDNPTN